MKRSEMLDEIGKVLSECFSFEEYPEACADDILRLVEKVGMLPPPEYHEQDREAKVACNTAKKYMEWEPEDD